MAKPGTVVGGLKAAGKKVKSAGRKTKRGLFGRSGQVSMGEAVVGMAIYTVSAMACLGLGAMDVTVFSQYAWLTMIAGALIVFGLDKSRVSETSLLELILLAVAILIPLCATSIVSSIPEIPILSKILSTISDAINSSDQTSKLIYLFFAIGALVGAAKRD